ncbi:MAG: GH3 auxin-responsive promoter, partial [Chitinophagaceae bacterium]
AIQKLESAFDIEVAEFTASTLMKDDEFFMEWFIGTDKSVDEAEAAKLIDDELCENNKNYKVARGKALKGVKVNFVPKAHFYKWSEEFKKMGGQTKIPRVMKEDDFREFGEFVAAIPGDGH